MTAQTLGEASHNPGNLRWNPRIAWNGEADPAKDGRGYCIFTDDLHGIRALARDLYTKWARGLRTVKAIIEVYAPPSENDTEAYIADVCQRLGVSGDTLLDLSRPGNLNALVRAIIIHENGRCAYTSALIAKAVSMALPASSPNT